MGACARAEKTEIEKVNAIVRNIFVIVLPSGELDSHTFAAFQELTVAGFAFEFSFVDHN